MNDTPSSDPTTVLALDAVLCTNELNRRVSRTPNHEKESRVLLSLAQALADSPETILQSLADIMVTAFECGSAGVSVVTEDGKRFRWPAIAGAWRPYIGSSTPREFGPCGDVLDRNCPLLFKHFQRRYRYLLPLTPPVDECLLVPFYVGSSAMGTIWVLTHADQPNARTFDREDQRLLTSLATFTSAAYQAAEQANLLARQGHEREEHVQTLRGVNEALLVSSVQMHELTEKAQRAEAAVRSSEVRYRRLFQTAKDGLLILDTITQKIIDANTFMCGLLGQDWSALVGKELHEIGVFADEEASDVAFAALQKYGDVRYEQLLLRVSNGETRLVEFVGSLYEDDRRLLAQCSVRDITARIALERQISDQSDVVAEEARRKDEFLAVLSHELRGPLAPIRTAIHLLRAQGGGAESNIVQHAHQVIDRQVGHLSRLVNELLEVSRIINGRIHLQRTTIDLSQAVRDALETVSPLNANQEHEVTATFPPPATGPVWVNVDPTRLEQIIVNLLTNAAKFTNKKGRIWVGVERSRDMAIVHVRDTGIGIAPDMLPRLFSLFAQADRSLDRSQGGLGIGLSIVQRLVEMHGGTTEARSDGLGKGSEFIVRLPLMAAPEFTSRLRPLTPQVHHTTGLRVLVVDDNVDGCLMLASFLRLHEHSVQTAHTGSAAVTEAIAWRPDVVLLDIGLPELDGYQVARCLRADPSCASLKLVAVTGYGNVRDIQLAREAGFDAHLLKPIDLNELQELLAGWIRSAPA